MTFETSHPDFEAHVRGSFARQGFMKTIGAELTDVRPGYCEIRLDYSESLTQQHGFIHGGVVATLADNAGGYAGFSLLDDGDGILTVEFKINLVAPAAGDFLLARGEVVRPGRTLLVTRADVLACKDDGTEKVCATMQQTLMRIVGRDDVTG